MVAGLVLGGIVGATVGGFWGLALRVPFLEHVVNVGGLAGAVVARLASVEWRRVPSPWSPARHALVALGATPTTPLQQRP